MYNTNLDERTQKIVVNEAEVDRHSVEMGDMDMRVRVGEVLEACIVQRRHVMSVIMQALNACKTNNARYLYKSIKF